MAAPRILKAGECWRIVRLERPDEHGVLRDVDYVETTEPKDKDCLGVQRWHQLTAKSALGDWMRVTQWLLDELLKEHR